MIFIGIICIIATIRTIFRRGHANVPMLIMAVLFWPAALVMTYCMSEGIPREMLTFCKAYEPKKIEKISSFSEENHVANKLNGQIFND
jgi:hypothetical protein